MPTQVLMPRLGESVDEGTITKWLKAAGRHRITEYEPLLEVNTDKVDLRDPQPGRAAVPLEILAARRSIVRQACPLAWIGAAGEAVPRWGTSLPRQSLLAETSLRPEVASAITATASQQAALGSRPRRRARPRPGFYFTGRGAHRTRTQSGLTQIPGTGQGGRITKQDVLNYLEKHPRGRPTPRQLQLSRPHPPSKASTPHLPHAVLPGEFFPLTNVRKCNRRAHGTSKHTSPHVTTVMEADLSRIIAHRQANKDTYAQDGVNLTFTAYFMAAAVAALKAYPIVNSSWSDAGIVLHHPINIGMAASLGEDGLIVPVIKNADSLSLLGLARTGNDLAAGRACTTSSNRMRSRAAPSPSPTMASAARFLPLRSSTSRNAPSWEWERSRNGWWS